MGKNKDKCKRYEGKNTRHKNKVKNIVKRVKGFRSKDSIDKFLNGITDEELLRDVKLGLNK